MRLRRGVYNPLAALGAASTPAGFTLTWRNHYADETDLTTYTAPSCDFGSAAADRIVVVGFWSASAANQTVSSVTIGGVTATQAVANGTSTRQVEIWFAAVPTGTTGDIVVTYSGTISRFGVDWWTITGTTQTTYAARANATAQIATATSVASTSLTVPTGGCAIVLTHVSSITDPVTWAQTSGVGTERTDQQIGTLQTTWGSSYDTLQAGSQAFTASGAESVARRIVAISWGP